MMQLTEFMRLQEAQQVELLYNRAVYIGKRCERRTILVLYQLEGFYVEIQYLRYRLQISRIHAFDSMDLLEPYLKWVDVEELMNC